MKKLLVLVVLLALALPLTASAVTVTYTSGFTVQNLSGSTATVQISFYDQTTGAQVASATINDQIPANAAKMYYPLSTVPAGFNGSAVVSSDQQVAAITNVLGNNSQRAASYGGFAAGATNVSLPLIMKNWYGINTWFNVQNAGQSDAHVTVAYSPGSCTEPATIKPGASVTFDQSKNGCLPTLSGKPGFNGAAKITSDQPIVAVVMQVNDVSLLAYNGFTGTTATPVFPQVTSNFYKSGTGISIQNTGSQATDVEVTYYPSAGRPGAQCKESHSIPAGQQVTYGFPQMPSGCGTQGSGVSDPTNGGFVGSAKVTANSTNQQLAAMVNIVTRGAGAADAYDAVDPATATSKVSMPIIMDRNYGLFTGIYIANVGNSATNVSCTFSGTSYNIPSTPLQPGQALSADQINKIASKYNGSGTCTASGGDAKIAGIINEVQQGAPSTYDVFTMYGAIGF